MCYKFTTKNVNELIIDGIIEKPIDGNHGSIHPKSEDYVERGIPFIMASDISNGRIDFTKCKFISQIQAESLRKGFAKNGDVLLTHKATIGLSAIVNYQQSPYIVLTPQVTYYRIINDNILHNYYLKCYFESNYFQKTIKLYAGSGSTRDYIGIIEQGRLPIQYPPIETQKKIAGVLATFDELIEVNRRKIKILEEMAQAVYNEWFVKMRFPGHEKFAPPIGSGDGNAPYRVFDSPLGPIPEGWEVKKINEMCDLIRDIETPGEHLSNIQYAPIECIGRKNFALFEWQSYTEAQSSLISFKKFDILFGAMRPYFHKVCIAPLNGVTRTTVFVIRPKLQISLCYLLMLLFQDATIEYANAHTNGTTIPYAVWNYGLGDMMSIEPDYMTLKSFNNQVIGYINIINELVLEIKTLSSLRDLLLPKLISGKIDVSELDIDQYALGQG